MRIAYDGKRAVQNMTGLGNYSRYLIEILCNHYPQNEYLLYAPKRKENNRLDLLLRKFPQLKIITPTSFINKLFSSLWRIWGIVGQLKKDSTKEPIALFHGISNELPLNIGKSHIKSIVTIHDLIFIHHPNYYHCFDRWIYTYKFKQACLHANKIIAISECTKRDIMRFFHIPEEKIKVVYQGCSPIFVPTTNTHHLEVIRKKYNLPEKYILSVGSIEERKNILLAIKALKELPADIHLVIVGKHTSYTEKAKQYCTQNQLVNRVHIFHKVAFEDLPAVYQLAHVFVYPSFFEGFGIPVIEAIRCGTPVIAATGSCLEEAGGAYSHYVNPNDVQGLVNAVNDILDNPQKSEIDLKKSQDYVSRFSEKEQAKQLIDLYQSVINE